MFENSSWVDQDYRAALDHLAGGRLQEAELMLRAVLAMAPNYPPAWFSLGQTLLRKGDTPGAAGCFTSLTEYDPGNVEGWLNLTRTLAVLGHGENAAAAANRAAALEPGSLRVLATMGDLCRRRLQLGEAETCFRQCLEQAPNDARFWADLGTVQQLQGDVDGARESYERALALNPDQPVALLNLSQVLLAAGDFAQLQPLVEPMLSAWPNEPDALRIAGEHARFEGRLDVATAHYQRSLEIRPNHAETLFALAQIFYAVGRVQEAVDGLARVTQIAPTHARAWASLGVVFAGTGQLSQAVEFYGKAIELDASQPSWMQNVAWAYFDLGMVGEAIAMLERAIAAGADRLAVESRVLYCLPFDVTSTPETIVARLRDWGTAMAAQAGESMPAATPLEERPLRVGYLLPDMRQPSLLSLVMPLLAAHDRTRLDLYAYSTTPNADQLPPALTQAAGHWRLIAGADRESIVAQIQRDGIDVLVEVTGHRFDQRLDVLAARAAPVQLSWLIPTGLSSGLPTVDAVLSDAILTPENDAALADRVERLPAYACYQGNEAAPDPGPLPALNGAVTFGYLGRVARLNDEVVAAWAAILAACPEATLLVDHFNLRQSGPQEHLRTRFAAHGIAAERIVAGFSVPVWPAWQKIDIALDPFPASAGASVLEGLWMGVPSVTRAGALPSGRFGTAIMTHVGLVDWIADSTEAYIARAVEAARDLLSLSELRAGLRSRLASSPMGDARGFAAALEATYTRLWQERSSTAERG